MALTRPDATRAEASDGGGAGRRLDPLVPGILVGGVIVTLVASLLLWSREVSTANDLLGDRRVMVVDSVERVLAQTTIRLIALAGLYQASDEVTELEFRRFAKNLGLSPGMDAIGYMPLVLGRTRESYQAEMRTEIPGFTIFELDTEGNPVPAAERRVYVPLQIWEPETAFSGIAGYDSMSHPGRAAALERARLTRSLTITPFLNLISESDGDGFLVYWTVTNTDSGALTGYTVAPMDLSDLMEAALTPLGGEILAWKVTDRTGETADDGAALLEVGGRVWEIGFTPAPRSAMVADPTYPLLLLGLGLLITAAGGSALRVRVRQRRAQADYDRLRELARAKDQFLASVGHELRTPLTSVLGFAELLRADGAINDEERRTMIAAVADEASDLAAIVDDLLVAARSELDLLVVQKVPISARAQVAQVLEISQRPDRPAVAVIADPQLPYRAAGDPGRVRQILRNLLTNAGRYGGQRVEIRLHEDQDLVRIEVRDDGPGVPEAAAERIFDPYYRAHPQGSQPAALGIGLAVARQLARLMGGDLGYRREEGWTVFQLVLPRARAVVEEVASEGRIQAPAF